MCEYKHHLTKQSLWKPPPCYHEVPCPGFGHADFRITHISVIFELAGTAELSQQSPEAQQ